MRIFIADDDTVILKLMSVPLTKAGHDVLCFEDGEALLEAYTEAPVPLVITDWMMPRATGIDVCQRIRRRKSVEYTHVIVVTSLSPAERTLEAFRAGADDFVSKPFKPEELVSRAAAVLRRSQAQEEAALRGALNLSQRALGEENVKLLETLEALATVTRQQRSFARCRAFVRRQLSIATESFGPSDARTEKLRIELDELRSLEDVV